MPLPLMAVGAGVGLLSGLFGGKPKPQMIDPESQAYLRQQRSSAMSMAGQPMPGLDPNIMAAIQMMTQYGNAGRLGLNAVSGDAGAASQFMNPYMSAMNPIFDRMRASSLNQLRSTATAQGAFGGNRLGLAEGAAMRGVDDSQSQFNYQGFQDAMSRAMQLASGMPQASDWLKNTGFDLTNRQRNWDIGSMGLMNAGFGMPFNTGQTAPQGPNIFQSMMGGALVGSSFGGGRPPAAPAAPAAPYAFDPNDPSHPWN